MTGSRSLLVSLVLTAGCSLRPADDPAADAADHGGVDAGDDGGGDAGPPPDAIAPADSPHLALGIPADATPDDDYLIVHDQMAIGYSRYLNAANWVSWRTRAEDFGPVPRYMGDFYPDTALPAGWFHPSHADLYGSGYDRGHMLRSEERTATAAANYATFVMTNVLAQRADLNRGPWFDFELYVQYQVESYSHPRDAYVIAGPVWSAACATHAPRVAGDGCTDVGQSYDPTHRIAVATATWKVVVFVDAGADPIDPSTARTVVAVVMPNISGIVDNRWYQYQSTVAEIEQETGYDLPSLE